MQAAGAVKTMGLSLWQLLLIAVLFLLLFGRGKIPALMTDLAAGIKNFKSGLREDSDETGKKTTADTERQTLDSGRLHKHGD